MQRNKIGEIFISAVIAIVLWFYVISVVNPPTTDVIKNVPVLISGQETLAERGLSVVGALDYTVDITVSGARNDVRELGLADFTASADIASFNRGEENIIVSVNGPKNITIDDIKNEKISVRVEDLVTESKSVKVFYGETKEGLEQTIFNYPESVNVSGAKTDVAKVACIRVDLDSNLLEVDKIKELDLPAVPVNASNEKVLGVKPVSETVALSAVLYNTKQVYLNVELTGSSIYGPNGIESTNGTTAISIKGTTENLAKVNKISTETVDISGLADSVRIRLNPNYPEGIYPSRSNGEFVLDIVISREAKEAYEQNLLQQENEEGNL